MSKICIICRNQKNNFNIEHIIPETIGSVFTTDLVCSDCNSDLGKYIDTPFLNDPRIGIERIKHNLKRGSRSIPNPFKGITITENGKEFTLSVNPDGRVERRLKPVKRELFEGGKCIGIQYEIDSKNKDIIDVLIKRVAKQFHIDEKHIKFDQPIYEQYSESKYKHLVADKVIVFEFLKVLYESSCLFFPDYINDERAIVLSKILHSQNVPEDQKKLVTTNQNLLNFVIDNFISKFFDDTNNSHVVFLTGIPRLGLIGIVKVFDNFHSIVLSENSKYYEQPYIMVVNNFKNKTASTFSHAGYKAIDFKFKEQAVIYDATPNTIIKYAGENSTPFIFDENGILISSNIIKYLSPANLTDINGNYSEELSYVYAVDECNIFIKIIAPIKSLIQIKQVILDMNVINLISMES